MISDVFTQKFMEATMSNKRSSRPRKRERPADPNLTYSITPGGDEGPGWLSENVGTVLIAIAIVILMLGTLVLTSG